MKKVIFDAFTSFGILTFILIIWALFTNQAYVFEKKTLLISLIYLALFLFGNYLRYKKKQKK